LHQKSRTHRPVVGQTCGAVQISSNEIEDDMSDDGRTFLRGSPAPSWA